MQSGVWINCAVLYMRSTANCGQHQEIRALELYRMAHPKTCVNLATIPKVGNAFDVELQPCQTATAGSHCLQQHETR